MKFLPLIFFLCLSCSSFGQQWVVTPNGLRNTADPRMKYLTISGGELSARKLYDNARKYIIENNPDSLRKIKLEWDSVALVFDTYLPYLVTFNVFLTTMRFDAYYTTELRFNAGSVRYEITFIDMADVASANKLTFRGSSITNTSVYSNKGKLLRPDVKEIIEKHFNGELIKMSEALNQP